MTTVLLLSPSYYFPEFSRRKSTESQTGIIVRDLYVIHDIMDLIKCNFPELRAVDSQTLPRQTFIQACKVVLT